MVNRRLLVYLIAVIGLSGFSAFVGFSISVAGPYTAAEALEEAIRGAETPDEVRSRITDYYSSIRVNRLLLLGAPSLAAAIVAALAIYELGKEPEDAVNDL